MTVGIVDDVSCIHWNQDEQKNSVFACCTKFLASIGTRMDKRTLLACWTKFLASIGTGMNRTLVGMLDEVSWHPLEPG